MQSKQRLKSFLRLVMYRTTKEFAERSGELQLPVQHEYVEFLQLDSVETEFYRQLSESLHASVSESLQQMTGTSDTEGKGAARQCLRSALNQLRMSW